MRLRWVQYWGLGLQVFRVWVVQLNTEPTYLNLNTWTPIPDLNTSISDLNSKPECQYWMWVFYTYQLTCILKHVYPNLNSEPEYLNVNTWKWLPEYEYWMWLPKHKPEYWAWLPRHECPYLNTEPEYLNTNTWNLVIWGSRECTELHHESILHVLDIQGP